MVYIQSDYNRLIPHHFDAACAMYGAIENCVDYRLTSFEEVKSSKYDNLLRTNLFVGSVEFMAQVFDRANVIVNPIINNNRDYQRLKIIDVKKSDVPLFIKPFQQKLFTGFVVDKWSKSSLDTYDDNLEVMCYEVINDIQSEWRLYVHYNKIIDSRNYSGDFRINPDYDYAEMIIRSFKHILPSAYTIDIGVALIRDDYYSFVVEFNDMYAIGNYGIDNTQYYRMLSDRYFEIMRRN